MENLPLNATREARKVSGCFPQIKNTSRCKLPTGWISRYGEWSQGLSSLYEILIQGGNIAGFCAFSDWIECLYNLNTSASGSYDISTLYSSINMYRLNNITDPQ